MDDPFDSIFGDYGFIPHNNSLNTTHHDSVFGSDPPWWCRNGRLLLANSEDLMPYVYKTATGYGGIIISLMQRLGVRLGCPRIEVMQFPYQRRSELEEPLGGALQKGTVLLSIEGTVLYKSDPHNFYISAPFSQLGGTFFEQPRETAPEPSLYDIIVFPELIAALVAIALLFKYAIKRACKWIEREKRKREPSSKVIQVLLGILHGATAVIFTLSFFSLFLDYTSGFNGLMRSNGPRASTFESVARGLKDGSRIMVVTKGHFTFKDEDVPKIVGDNRMVIAENLTDLFSIVLSNEKYVGYCLQPDLIAFYQESRARSVVKVGRPTRNDTIPVGWLMSSFMEGQTLSFLIKKSAHGRRALRELNDLIMSGWTDDILNLFLSRSEPFTQKRRKEAETIEMEKGKKPTYRPFTILHAKIVFIITGILFLVSFVVMILESVFVCIFSRLFIRLPFRNPV